MSHISNEYKDVNSIEKSILLKRIDVIMPRSDLIMPRFNFNNVANKGYTLLDQENWFRLIQLSSMRLPNLGYSYPKQINVMINKYYAKVVLVWDTI